ncbi:CynX/NimT family MFS transporter [Sphingomonas flavalba]|uniref:MFS transporter n=1 Tax=Sphingomonas flavalba TaxID=2559804 RepID=UPI0039E1640E
MSIDTENPAFFRQRWALFAVISLFFFLITAATFSSLGIVLPFMIDDLGWTRLEAGTGFSLLALMVGIAAPVPAYLLRKIGPKGTYLIGGGLVILGTVLLATTQSLMQYYLGASILGFGYGLCASVPAIYLITTWFPDRAGLIIGTYMTIGATGGIAAPFIVTTAIGSLGGWPAHWWALAAAMLGLCVLAAITIRSAPPTLPDSVQAMAKAQQNAGSDGRVHRSQQEWTFKQVIRTPQYYIIVFSLTLILLCSVTMNSWAFTHMMALGVTTTMAAAVLSAQAVVNALSRVIGGTLANHIDPKWLLVSALAADVVGMAALSYADHPIGLWLFAIGDGYGFGMCYFATTMLLVNYFGAKVNPEILGAMNFITTLAMIGPALAGMMSESLGGFVWVFRGCALLLLLFVVVVIAMRPPRRAEGDDDTQAVAA